LAYKICPRGEWLAAEAAGAYAGSPVDARDGYIHLSAAPQVRETMRRHFAEARDLICLAVDLDMLGQAVKWERSRGGELFPHLYGALPIAAVRSAFPAPDAAEARDAFAASLRP
jgi:uncharacterized protein (DUF952 family)